LLSVVLELVRKLHSLSCLTVFSAFPSLPENSSFCQTLCFHPHIEPLIIVDSGCNSKSEPKSDRRTGILENRCCANFERSTSPTIEGGPSQFWLTKTCVSGSCNGMFSAGFPTGERGTCLASPNEPASLYPLRNRLPNHDQATLRSSTALKQLFESIISHSLLQARVRSLLDHSEYRLPCAAC
jgi:hypothetical protein